MKTAQDPKAKRSQFPNLEASLVEAGPSGSTARAVVREIEKSFLEGLATLPELDLKGVVFDAVMSSTEDENVRTKAVKACLLSLSPGTGLRGGVYGRLAEALPSSPTRLVDEICFAVVRSLKKCAPLSVLEAAVEKSLDSPSKAVASVLASKRGKFFTRGMDESQIWDTLNRELATDMKKAISKDQSI